MNISVSIASKTQQAGINLQQFSHNSTGMFAVLNASVCKVEEQCDTHIGVLVAMGIFLYFA